MRVFFVQLCFTTLVLSVFAPESVGANEAVWIEGEDYLYTEWNNHGWYRSTNITMDLLSPGEPGVSDGDWHVHLSSAGGPDSASATYRFNITEGGTYTWWIRLNPFRNSSGGADYSYRYRPLSGGWTDWQDLDVCEARMNTIDLVDPGIDIRFIAWSYGDTFDLAPGTYELQVRLSDRDGADTQTHGGIDVMTLTNFPWAPTGVIPPDPDPPAAEPDDWFMLMSGPDPYSPNSITDMSGLLDKPAGVHGFLEQQGKDFVFEDGTPARFWGMDASMNETVAAQQRQARFYAKHGINIVRQHPIESFLGPLLWCGRLRCFDAEKLDMWDRWFSILKENGIYMTWSIFYHHAVFPAQKVSNGGTIADELFKELPYIRDNNPDDGNDTYGFATFIEEYQDYQWEYARAVLEHVNPYTGLAYKDDPALAIVECRNEDSIFWHSPLGDGFVRGLNYPNHGDRLKLMWQQWVKNEYGNDAALAAAWGEGLKTSTIYNGDGSVRSYPDSVDETKMYIYAAWEMEKDGPRWNKTKEKKRMGDLIRFLAEMQRNIYETYRQRLSDIGYKAVTVSTAWRAGGPAASAANLWTDDAMGAIDRHNYFGGGAGGHNITTGSVNNDTHMNKPARGILSSGLWQVEDKPFIITEWTQKPPNQWKAEIAPLMAFYGMGLQGWDALYHFAGSRSYMGDGWPSMRSYVTETPHYIGQFPALTFAIYNGHIAEGDIVSARRLSTDEIFAGIDVLEQEFGQVGYDENELLAHGDTPIEALAVGRVTLKVADDQNDSYLADLTGHWDQTAQTVTSNTSQLTWDYNTKVVTVQTEKTQGIIGFPGGRSYDLPGVIVEPGLMHFVSLLFTPLDDRPLTDSEHILVTALAQDKQYGTTYSRGGTELLEAGGPPLLLEPVRATLTFKGRPISSVKVVDFHGVPTAQDVERTGNTFAIDGRYRTYYYEVKRPTTCQQANADGANPVNFADYPAFADDWEVSGAGLVGDLNGNGSVDASDLAAFADYWLDYCEQ